MAAPKPDPANNVTVQLALTYEEIFSGVKKKINYRRKEACNTCKGNRKDSSGITCRACNGTGLNSVDRSVDVEVPAGVQKGMVMGLKNQGHQVLEQKKVLGLFKRKSSSSEPGFGNLEIHIDEKPHDVFLKNGADLVYECDLTKAELPLGLTREIPIFGEPALKFKIPAHAQDGNILRIKGKGFPGLGKMEPGNLLIVIKVID